MQAKIIGKIAVQKILTKALIWKIKQIIVTVAMSNEPLQPVEKERGLV